MSRLFLAILFILLLFSCKKEEENTPPKIIFTTPTESQSFQAGDTIQIVARINDNQKIKNVSLSLVELNSKLLKGPIKYFEINAKEYELSYAYILPEYGFNTVNHYFEIQATDGQLESAAFLSIRINQKEKVKMGWLLIEQNGAQTSVFKVDSFKKPIVKIIDFSSDFKNFAFNMEYQHLWILPKGKIDLLTIDIEQKVIANRITAPLTQFSDGFSSILYDAEETFVGDNTGVLQAYNPQFIDKFTYQSDQNYRPKLFDLNETYLLVVEQASNFSISRISLLYRKSGGLISSSVISKNVRAVKMITSQSALLLCDSNNGLEVFDYDINRGVYTSLLRYSLSPNEQFLCFQEMKKDDFLLTTNQKMFNYIPPNKLSEIVAANIETSNYDPIDNEILLLTKDSLRLIDGNDYSAKQGLKLNGNFKAVIPWYSR